MFDLILDKVDRPYRKRSRGAAATSLCAHVILITCVFVVPILYVTDGLPKVPVMMAFVATTAEAPPPPPPPPPPAAARPASEARLVPTRPSASADAAPLEAAEQITPEPKALPSEEGQVGGVEGGVAGGRIGGIVGGLVAALPPPTLPPPVAPPPAATHEAVRIGGLVVAPALVRRVEPEYPAIAIAAQVEGLVILEATVDTEGRVESVRILRSRGLLDKAAIDAVSRWRYAPLTLNGIPTRFVLTVTLNFALTRPQVKDAG